MSTDHVVAHLHAQLQKIQPPERQHWSPCGPDTDPTLRILGQMHIAGVPFHVEAFRVRRTDGVQIIDDRDDIEGTKEVFQMFEDYSNGVNPDDDFQTIDVDGREYVLFIFPHGD